ncbi:MAG: DsbA family protein [Pseudomonadota bacterium]
MNLIYVADPMCSWCYGFSKELSELSAQFPHIPVQIVVGGVRAGASDVLDEAGKRFRLQHWTRVAAASGLPFNRQAFAEREGFVYDTEPVCRAVVTARTLEPSANILDVFRALQHAFYVDALDTTDGRVLAEVASAALRRAGFPIDADSFHATWLSPATIAATKSDFITARSWGVASFPLLLLAKNGRLHSVTPGYVSAQVAAQNLSAILEAQALKDSASLASA